MPALNVPLMLASPPTLKFPPRFIDVAVTELNVGVEGSFGKIISFIV